ncbi:MAG: FlgD immunoglobulin-like domain containing protein, partial [bacterium]
MQPGEIVRIGYKEIVLPELSPNIRLLINETKAAAENEDPLKLANNIAIDTIYAYSAITTYPIAAQPGIEASPSVVDIGQPVSLRVRFPKEPASWDIWAYFADGRIDSAFADQTIAWLPAPPVDAWQPLPEIFTNTRLVTEARREHITFEMRVVDRDGLFAKNAVDVVVQSTNAFTLERNVFEPDLHALNIRFKLSSNRTARLDVYNLAGQHVTKLAEQPYNAGWHSQRWDGRTEGGEQVVSGVYLITIRSGDFNAWKRCILVR